MQFKLNKKYLMYIFYICLATTAIFISYNIIFHIGKIVSTFFTIFHAFMTLMKPLIIGIVIAYLLYPISKFIGRFLKKTFKMKEEPHLLSVALTYIIVVVSFVLIIYASYSMISGEISHNKNISSMMDSINTNMTKYNEIFDYINDKIEDSGLSVDAKSYLSTGTKQISKYATKSVGGIFEFSKSAASVIINGFLGLCISFYLLKDYESFKKKYAEIMLIFINKERLYSINNTIREIDDIMSKFIRGQLLDAFFVGILSCIGLTIIGLDFAIPIGFIAGLANIVPYVGPIVGCVPAIIVGVLSPHPIVALWSVLVFFIVQQIDNSLISPKIVGTSTGHNPVLVIMAIVVGGALGGILGMLLAVPMLGILKLFILKYINKKKQANVEKNIRNIDVES